MKKTLAFCMALILFALCAGCGSASQTAETTANAAEAAAVRAVDIDLSTMGSNMVYSEVAQILNDPDAYIGKTIRAKGPFKQNNGYYFVLINDATACCAQGLEFIWSGQHSFPQDYPAVDTEIVVTGTFNSYMEGDQKYYHLENAALETA